jgi:simple sugar transport system ATP-binding protein
VSLALRAGEIVGIAGVSGNGQSELLDVLAGLLVPSSGSLRLRERSFTPALAQQKPARELAWPMCPKTALGLRLVLPVRAWESAVLGYARRARYSPSRLDAQAARCAPTRRR